MKRFAALLILFALAAPAFAGNIDPAHTFAWGENVGWVNFGTSQGDVTVSPTGITGYAWGENVGWILLNNLGRSGDDVTGYAWGENVGWISFNCSNTGTCGSVDYKVTIGGSSGIFTGYAWGENVGWISFNCSNTGTCGTVDYSVVTTEVAGAVLPPPPPPSTPTPTPIPTLTPTLTPTPGTPTPTPIPTATPVLTPTPFPTLTPILTPPPTATPTPILPTLTPFPTETPTLSPPPVFPSTSPPPTSPTTQPPTPTPGPGGGFDIVLSAADAIDTIAETIFTPLADIGCDGVVGAAACAVTAPALAVGVAMATAIVLQQEAAGIFNSMFEVMGLRRKRKAWGTVYDSVTKRPVPFARVELYDNTNRLLETYHADRDGQYGFLITPRSLALDSLTVYVRASKPGYQFPSSAVSTGTDFLVYEHPYGGGPLEMRGDDFVHANIPIDPISGMKSHWSGFSTALFGNLSERLLALGFYVGLVLVPLNVFYNPNLATISIAIVFVVANLFRLFVVYRPYGVVGDSATGRPLAYALVTLNDTTGKRIGFSVSDQYGRYILSGEKGASYDLDIYTPANVVPVRSARLHITLTNSPWVTEKLTV